MFIIIIIKRKYLEWPK